MKPEEAAPPLRFSQQRIVQSLLGGALADAMAAGAEGAPPSPTRSLPAGPLSTTDDTALTFVTTDAIVANGGAVSPEAVADAFVQTYRRGRVAGVGSSTLRALQLLDGGAHWASAGHQGEFGKGAGPAMRAAPLAFVLDPSDWDQRRTLRFVCEITHRSDEAFAGAALVALTVRGAASGHFAPEDGPQALDLTGVPDSVLRDRMRGLPPDFSGFAARFGTSGFTPDAVPAALYVAQEMAQHSFERGVLAAVRAGGDTDTTHRRTLPPPAINETGNSYRLALIIPKFVLPDLTTTQMSGIDCPQWTI